MYNFPSDYFKDEYREGFLVESMVKRAWAAQLEVLFHIVKICEKYDLQYWAMWGTLLGAVRHNGYVPWDDDLDIAMKREDYDKFIEVAASELPDGYVVMSPYTNPEWKELLARVTNSHSIKFTEEFLDNYHGFPYSTGVDIFPYDYLPDDEKTRDEQATLINLVVQAREQVVANADFSVIEKDISYLENLFGFEFNKECYLDNQLLCLIDQLSSGYGNTSCKKMTCLGERAKRQAKGSDFIIPAFLLEETVSHKFEDFTIMVPKYYELVLSLCYGKRFIIPVKTGISGHEYPFFKGQQEVLDELGRLDEVMEAIRQSDLRCDRNLNYSESNIASTSGLRRLSEEENNAQMFSNNKAIISRIETIKNNNKKILLYCMSSMDVYEHEEEALAKLENTLKYLSKKKDEISTILIEDQLVESLLSRKDERLNDKYSQIVQSYLQNDEIILCSSDAIELIVEYCHAYYGSANEYAACFKRHNKPVMIQNLEILSQ